MVGSVGRLSSPNEPATHGKRIIKITKRSEKLPRQYLQGRFIIRYRPPNNHFDSFETEMNQMLGQIDKENKLCYLMGDFNIDLLKSESCDYTIRFLEQLFTSSYVPLVRSGQQESLSIPLH